MPKPRCHFLLGRFAPRCRYQQPERDCPFYDPGFKAAAERWLLCNRTPRSVDLLKADGMSAQELQAIERVADLALIFWDRDGVILRWLRTGMIRAKKRPDELIRDCVVVHEVYRRYEAWRKALREKESPDLEGAGAARDVWA